MIFFSGFCLENEQNLFKFWLEDSDFVVAGFSYGAIKAVEYSLNLDSRIDRLILLSPAFFNDKDEKFKRAQLLYFKKDKNRYIKNFLQNASSGCNIDLNNYFKEGSYNELKELLYYQWDEKKIERLLKRGITIEVILGGNDKIIDACSALDFFKRVTSTYYIKDANHILKRVK